MGRNGTPASWSERAAKQAPRHIVVAGKSLDPDPLTVEEEPAPSKRDDWLALGLAFIVLGGLVLVAIYGPTFLEWARTR